MVELRGVKDGGQCPPYKDEFSCLNHEVPPVKDIHSTNQRKIRFLFLIRAIRVIRLIRDSDGFLFHPLNNHPSLQSNWREPPS